MYCLSVCCAESESGGRFGVALDVQDTEELLPGDRLWEKTKNAPQVKLQMMEGENAMFHCGAGNKYGFAGRGIMLSSEAGVNTGYPAVVPVSEVQSVVAVPVTLILAALNSRV